MRSETEIMEVRDHWTKIKELKTLKEANTWISALNWVLGESK